MFVAAPSLRGDLFKHAVRGCDEAFRISSPLVGGVAGTGGRIRESPSTRKFRGGCRQGRPLIASAQAREGCSGDSKH